MSELYPLVMQPACKEYLWGGRKIVDRFNREYPVDRLLAESWEIADHSNGHSIVANGPLAGNSLGEVLAFAGPHLLGTSVQSADIGKFPLMVKYIDALQSLSVQVHPDDELAKVMEFGELGKTEAWYVIQADPGACLYAGLNSGTTSKMFAEAIQQGTLERVLLRVAVQAGDVLQIPAGLVHAIGSGLLLAEIQENSDTTYRVFDWNRLGMDGKPRETHVEKAIQATDVTLTSPVISPLTLSMEWGTCDYLVACCYYLLQRWQLAGKAEIRTNGERFELLMVLDGELTIFWDGGGEPIQPGTSMVIPAESAEYIIAGNATVLRAFIPHLQNDVVLPLREAGHPDSAIASLGGGPLKNDLQRLLG